MTAELILTYAAGSCATLLAGVLAAWYALKKGLVVPRWAGGAVLLLSAYLLAAQLLKYYGLKQYVDFTVWVQVADGIATSQGPQSVLEESIHPGRRHFFSAHFVPLVYVFGWGYRLLRRPETLLVLQYAALMATPVLLAAYVRRQPALRNQAAAFAALVVLFPTFQYIALYEFEMMRFSMPLVLLALWALESGRSWLYWAAISGALLIREEVGLAVAGLGIYLAVTERRRKTGLATAAAGLAYFGFALFLAMPFFRQGPTSAHIAAHHFATLGATPAEFLKGFFTRPDLVAGLVLDPLKLANLLMYGLPFLFVPLLRWPLLMAGSGTVGLNLLGDSVTYTSYSMYYLAPMIPLLLAATVKGTLRLGRKLECWPRSAALADREAGRRGPAAIVFGLFVGGLACNLFFGPSPLSLQFWLQGYRIAPFRTQNYHYSQYRVTERHREFERIAALVPREASVSAEQHLLPRLYDRRGVRVFPDIRGADYVVIDKLYPIKSGIGTIPGSWDGMRQRAQYYYDWVEEDPAGWRLVAARSGYHVFARRERAREAACSR